MNSNLNKDCKMATKIQVLPSVPHKSIFTSGDLPNCRRASRVMSLFWPFRRHSKMFHTDSSSLPKLDLILHYDEKIHKSVPSSPVSLPKDSSNRKMPEDISYLSSSNCSSGYSSGYSSGDSATTESDLALTIAKVSTTEIGSSGFILPNTNKFLSKKRNSKDNIKFLSSSFPKNDSHQLENTMNNGLPSSNISPIASVSLESTNSSNIIVDLSLSDIDILPSCPKRPSATSITSSTSSVISTEGSPRRRVKDDEGFIRRAACVCVNNDETKVVLISSKNSGGGWLVPGGGLEAGEEESAAAQREAWEEAGITGSIKRRLGIFEMEDVETHKRKRTAVYVLEVAEQHSTFPEASLGRIREWYSIDAAINHLSKCKPHQIAYLKALQLSLK